MGLGLPIIPPFTLLSGGEWNVCLSETLQPAGDDRNAGGLTNEGVFTLCMMPVKVRLLDRLSSPIRKSHVYDVRLQLAYFCHSA